MKKVGIMGGTFNPIHNGHLMIAKSAQEQCALDEVIFMPCGVPYMKRGQHVENGKVRAEMTALAIRDIPHFLLSTLEIDQAGNTYTYETMEYLAREHPDTEYYFILGADSLFHITKWVHPERIFAACHILTAVRGSKSKSDVERQIVFLKKRYAADIRLLKTDAIDISSSEIRRKVSAGESVAEYLPKDVMEYMKENGLYL